VKFLFLSILLPGILVAWPYSTPQTGKGCLYCHVNPDGTGPLTEPGEYYKQHGTLDGYEESKPSEAPKSRFAVDATVALTYESLLKEDAADGFSLMEGKVDLVFEPREDVQVVISQNLDELRRAFAKFSGLPWDGSLKIGLFKVPFGLPLRDHTALTEEGFELGLEREDVGASLRANLGPLSGEIGAFNGHGKEFQTYDDDSKRLLAGTLEIEVLGLRLGLGGFRDASANVQKELYEGYAMGGIGPLTVTGKQIWGRIRDRRKRGYEVILTLGRGPTTFGHVALGFFDPDRDIGKNSTTRVEVGVSHRLFGHLMLEPMIRLDSHAVGPDERRFILLLIAKT
jgi:hypothetical protein